MAGPPDASPAASPSGVQAQQQNQCLPRSARIRVRRDFLKVQARGARAHGQLLISIAARGAAGGARLGITASKKVGKAVQRNRAKRLIREAFRRQRAELPGWLDLVVIARPAIVGASLQQVIDDLTGAATRAVQALQRRGPDSGRSRRRRPQRSDRAGAAAAKPRG